MTHYAIFDPAKYVVAPREPTYDMEIAGTPIAGAGRFFRNRLYREMIAAAPPEPTPADPVWVPWSGGEQ